VGKQAARTALHGPGLVLAGGGGLQMPPAALPWMRRTLGDGRKGRFGNVLAIGAGSDPGYDRPFYDRGGFASVHTALIPPCASRAQVDSVAPLVDRADAIFFAGGDQANYVAWKGTRLMAAVKRLYTRGGIVGGGSAGLAIQGQVAFDAVVEDRLNLETHTTDAVRDPLERRLSFTKDLFSWPALRGTITDTHLVVRDRLGRLAVFMARAIHDGLLRSPDFGLGIDQASAVVVDKKGMATVLNRPGGGGAYLLRGGRAARMRLGAPILTTISVTHIARTAERFDLLHKKSPEPWYRLVVDGSKRPPYSHNPY